MRYRSLGLIFAGIGFLLLLAALISSCAPAAAPTGPTQGPPVPTATEEPAMCVTPTCPPPEDYHQLKEGESLDMTHEGVTVTLTWKDGEVTVSAGNSSSSTHLEEGYHAGDFTLIKDGEEIARSRIDVLICDGNFYHNDYIITPIPRQLPEEDI